MDLETLKSFEWSVMTPEFIILGVAALLTLLDLFLPKKVDRKLLGWIGLAGILAAIISVASLLNTTGAVSILDDSFTLDAFGKAFKIILLSGSALVMLLAVSYESKEGLEDYRGEFYYLFLTALLGAMVMTSSGDLITLFIGLELLTVSSYILVGIRKHNRGSNEAAMKYVINGGISTAITLFGMSYVYGLTGTTNLYAIAQSLTAVTDGQQIYLLGLSFLMIFVGLSFKLASAPFHMWAPDVYQGAPTPVTAFLSVISKTAGFVIVIRILISVFYNAAPAASGQGILFQMQDYLAAIAAVTMIIGNVVALKQSDIKRMFAYSSIAHAGYILVALTTLSSNMLFSIWFYLLAYMLMNLGAFAIIQIVTEQSGSTKIADFAGLYRRSPVLAVLMGILLVSLAGFPGTAGFIGKMNIFVGTFYGTPHYVLAAIMIATTVVSYFYYFGVMTQMFFRPAADESKLQIPPGIVVVLLVAIVGSILFGIAPNIALDFLNNLQ